MDVKVCAIDGTWSGLKLVVPVKDRPAAAKAPRAGAARAVARGSRR